MYFRNFMRGGLDPSGISASNRRIADIQERGAANYQKAAQANMQVANRNYVDEANKLAAAQAAQKNAQKVRNLGNASAGAAALARGTEEADYQAQMSRADQQREQGVRNQDYENRMRQNAEASRAAAKQRDYTARDRSNRNAWGDYVSMGPPPGGPPKGKGRKPEPDTEEQPPDPSVTENPPITENNNNGKKRLVPWQHFYNWVAGSQDKAVGDNDEGAGANDSGMLIWGAALRKAGLEDQFSPEDFKEWALTPEEMYAAYQEGVREGLKDPNVKLWPAYLDKLSANGQDRLRAAAEQLSVIANEGRGGPDGLYVDLDDGKSQHYGRNDGDNRYREDVSRVRGKNGEWILGPDGEWLPVNE